MTRSTVVTLIALSLVAQACEGDNNNEQSGKCLTDEQICSLELGVSKKDDIIKRFGTPSLSSSGTSINPNASYTCARLEGGVEAYSQGVFLDFDDSFVLKDVQVIRSGPDAKPTPACVEKRKS